MVVILKQNVQKEKIDSLIHNIESMGVQVNYSEGEHVTVIGLIGDTSRVDVSTLRANEIIEDIKRISQPYKAANRKFHPDDTVLEIGGRKVGAGFFNVIAGPCSIESEEQLNTVAQKVKESGAAFLRGGAFKPRTSPYSFQGMELDGLKLLLRAKELTGLPIVTEIMGEEQIPDFENVDIIQVGARNMQNFRLLKALGRTQKPILLKRGLSATIEEFLMSAEYIMAGGNPNVILCERGIRTFETMIRNTLDISAVPLLKQQSHLPVIIDPSHAAGIAWMVEPLSKAAIAAGADGLMVEVHHDPKNALCDGAQSLTPERFDQLMKDIRRRALFEGRHIE